MSRTILTAGRVSVVVLVLASVLVLAGCPAGGAGGAAVPASRHVARVDGRTLIDESYNCRISAPNAKWSVEAKYARMGDAMNLGQLNRVEYNACVTLAVSRYRQPTLAAFAGVGSYNPTESRFTYVAGKPCFYATKPVTAQGFTFNTAGYKFVSEGKGYIITIVYPQQFTHHDGLQQEIDEVLNSFGFLRPDTQVAASPEGKPRPGKPKLTKVAVLELIDLSTGKASETTRGLTSALQDRCAARGRFQLLERRDLKGIAAEHDLARSGMLSGDPAVRAGKLLGADYLITGNLGTVGGTWVVYAQVVDARTGAIVSTASMRRKKGNPDALLDTIAILARKLAEGV